MTIEPDVAAAIVAALEALAEPPQDEPKEPVSRWRLAARQFDDPA
jgi:hypothetical protein